ncbi:MAG: hypothetical protein MZV70_69765 [Desulfobacterales bacterium]|nr:hypothetical protein [Desulfobacterales bacterium]
MADGVAYRAFLKPGDKPEATSSRSRRKPCIAREYCNLHGLWKA